jgi:hypothetical protein
MATRHAELGHRDHRRRQRQRRRPSVTFKAKPANTIAGVTSAMLTAASINGDTVSSPVLLSINKDQHKLLPPRAPWPSSACRAGAA